MSDDTKPAAPEEKPADKKPADKKPAEKKPESKADTPAQPDQANKPEKPAVVPAAPDQTRLVATYKYDRPWLACRFDPSGRYLFAAAEDFRIQRYDLSNENVEAPPTTFLAHDSWVRAIGFAPDGQTLLTGGYDGRLIWWPATADEPKPLRQIDAHAGWIRALAVSHDGRLVATCGNDLLVRVWQFDDGRLVHELPGHESHVYQVAFAPDDAMLVAVDLHGHVRRWQVADGTPLDAVQATALHKYDTSFMADIGGARGLAFHPSGQRVAAAGITNVTNAFAGVGEPILSVVDLAEGKVAIEHRAKANFRGVAWNVCWHPDGYWVAVSGGGGGGYLLFWRPDEKNEFHNFKLPNTGRDMDLHPDGLRIAVAHGDKQLRVYTMAPAAQDEAAPADKKSK